MSRGIRPRIRAAVGCPSCGAEAGQRCVAYVLKPGKTVGKESEDVHAARWYAFMDGLARAAAAQLRLGGTVGDEPAGQRARAVARLNMGRFLPGLRRAVRGR